ncbi:MAG: hypothetical protein K8U57_11835 [Planctomycetes bacterium]|nr:hypothetical protein [Planctomycetota bacterium]
MNRIRIGGLASAAPRDLGHRSIVRAVGYTPDGKRIVTIGGAQAIHWNASSGKQVGALVSLGEDGTFVEDASAREVDSRLSPDARLLAVAHAEGIKLIDVATGTEQLTCPLPQEGDSIRSISFSQDGKRLAAAISRTEKDPDNFLIVWNTETGRVVFEKHQDSELTPNHVVLSPDGSKLFVVVRFRSEWTDSVVQQEIEWACWDLATGKLLGQMEIPEGYYSAVPLADNRSILTSHSDGKLAVLDLVAGKFTRLFDWDTGTAVAVSPDGKLIATQHDAERGGDGKFLDPLRIVICDLTTGKAIRRIALPLSPANVSGPVPLAFSPDGKHLLTGHIDGTSTVWEIAALPVAK